MKTTRLICCGLSAVCLALLLNGCANAQFGRSFLASSVARLQVGSTTKAQVAELFGPPYVEIDKAASTNRPFRFGDEETVVTFRYLHGYGTLFDSDSQPSHRIWQKKVGGLMKTCHTAGHEKTKSSNRRQIDRAQSALQVHSSLLGAKIGQGDKGGREG